MFFEQNHEVHPKQHARKRKGDLSSERSCLIYDWNEIVSPKYINTVEGEQILVQMFNLLYFQIMNKHSFDRINYTQIDN